MSLIRSEWVILHVFGWKKGCWLVYGQSMRGDRIFYLATPVTPGQVVTLSYTDPTSGDDIYAVQDVFSNDAVSFTNVPVTLVGVSA